ncbi:hypothetical protein CDAR_433541, partial [Caerostris darwini]
MKSLELAKAITRKDSPDPIPTDNCFSEL